MRRMRKSEPPIKAVISLEICQERSSPLESLIKTCVRISNVGKHYYSPQPPDIG